MMKPWVFVLLLIDSLMYTFPEHSARDSLNYVIPAAVG